LKPNPPGTPFPSRKKDNRTLGTPIYDVLLVVLIGAGLVVLALIVAWPRLLRRKWFRIAALLVLAATALFALRWIRVILDI